MILNTIILSFVVQNFTTTHFLIKTQKYKFITISHSIPILFALMKLHISTSINFSYTSLSLYHVNYLHNRYFKNIFWLKFKPFFTNKLGNVVLNLPKTVFINIYTKLLFSLDTVQKKKNLKYEAAPTLPYLKPSTLIPFSFQISTYNSLIFFVLTLLTSFYTPPRLEFKLFYAYVWKSQNFLAYDFLNRFYFRLKNY